MTRIGLGCVTVVALIFAANGVLSAQVPDRPACCGYTHSEAAALWEGYCAEECGHGCRLCGKRGCRGGCRGAGRGNCNHGGCFGWPGSNHCASSGQCASNQCGATGCGVGAGLFANLKGNCGSCFSGKFAGLSLNQNCGHCGHDYFGLACNHCGWNRDGLKLLSGVRGCGHRDLADHCGTGCGCKFRSRGCASNGACFGWGNSSAYSGCGTSANAGCGTSACAQGNCAQQNCFTPCGRSYFHRDYHFAGNFFRRMHAWYGCDNNCNDCGWGDHGYGYGSNYGYSNGHKCNSCGGTGCQDCAKHGSYQNTHAPAVSAPASGPAPNNAVAPNKQTAPGNQWQPNTAPGTTRYPTQGNQHRINAPTPATPRPHNIPVKNAPNQFYSNGY